jgi:DNA-binding transcriptional ArsR family regulator
MPLELSRRPRTHSAQIAVSAATELYWVLSYLQHHRPMPAASRHQVFETLSDRLIERVASFWDDGVHGYTELLVIADGTSTLASPRVEPLLNALAGKAHIPLAEDALRTESETDQAAFLKRLRALASRSSVRSRYASLLGAVWKAVGPAWVRDGRPMVNAAARDWSRRIAAGGDLDDILSQAHIYFHYPEMIARLPEKPVTLSPSYYATLGGHIVDLPSTIHLAASVGPVEAADAVREQARHLAPRLKILGDPTRLAILLILATENRTISDLTKRFAVSQPTISGHVKALREEGMVEAHKTGGRVYYRASMRALEDLVREASRALGIGDNHHPG